MAEGNQAEIGGHVAIGQSRLHDAKVSCLLTKQPHEAGQELRLHGKIQKNRALNCDAITYQLPQEKMSSFFDLSLTIASPGLLASVWSGQLHGQLDQNLGEGELSKIPDQTFDNSCFPDQTPGRVLCGSSLRDKSHSFTVSSFCVHELTPDRALPYPVTGLLPHPKVFKACSRHSESGQEDVGRFRPTNDKCPQVAQTFSSELLW